MRKTLGKTILTVLLIALLATIAAAYSFTDTGLDAPATNITGALEVSSTITEGGALLNSKYVNSSNYATNNNSVYTAIGLRALQTDVEANNVSVYTAIGLRMLLTDYQTDNSSTWVTINQKYGPVIDVSVFGANGSDGADDSSAFQTAINTACGGVGSVSIPAGTFNISEINITCATPVNLLGVGVHATIIQISGNLSNGFIMGNTTNNLAKHSLQGMIIYGHATDEGDSYDTNVSIFLQNMHDAIFRDVYLVEGKKGIYSIAQGTGNYAYNNLFENVYIEDFEEQGMLFETVAGGTDNWQALMKLSNVWVNDCGRGLELLKGASTGQMGAGVFSNLYLETGTSGDLILIINDSSNNMFSNTILDGYGSENSAIITGSYNVLSGTNVAAGEILDSGNWNYIIRSDSSNNGFFGKKINFYGLMGINTNYPNAALDVRNNTNIRKQVNYGTTANSTYLTIGPGNSLSDNGNVKAYNFEVRTAGASSDTTLAIMGNTCFNNTDPEGLYKVETSASCLEEQMTLNNGMLYAPKLRTSTVCSGSCTAGQIGWNASHVCICTATNTWKTAALS